MSTKDQTKRIVFRTLRLTEEMDRDIRELNINFPDTVRELMKQEIDKVKREKHGKNRIKSG